jgi:hypothetical protein
LHTLRLPSLQADGWELRDLKSQLAALSKSAAARQQPSTDHNKPSASNASLGQGQLEELEQRLGGLEGAVASLQQGSRAAAGAPADAAAIAELARQVAEIRADVVGSGTGAQDLRLLAAQLAGKADAGALAALEVAVASKAGREEVDSLRLEAAVARGGGAGAGAGGAGAWACALVAKRRCC